MRSGQSKLRCSCNNVPPGGEDWRLSFSYPSNSMRLREEKYRLVTEVQPAFHTFPQGWWKQALLCDLKRQQRYSRSKATGREEIAKLFLALWSFVNSISHTGAGAFEISHQIDHWLCFSSSLNLVLIFNSCLHLTFDDFAFKWCQSLEGVWMEAFWTSEKTTSLLLYLLFCWHAQSILLHVWGVNAFAEAVLVCSCYIITAI